MTVHELRVFLQSWQCGCGSPEDATAGLRALLEIHPLYEHQAELKALLPDERFRMMLLYMLSDWELAEHGGSCGGAWLTSKGKAVLEAIQAHGNDVMDGNFCGHGYSVETEIGKTHECDEFDRSECLSTECAYLNGRCVRCWRERRPR